MQAFDLIKYSWTIQFWLPSQLPAPVSILASIFSITHSGSLWLQFWLRFTFARSNSKLPFELTTEEFTAEELVNLPKQYRR